MTQPAITPPCSWTRSPSPHSLSKRLSAALACAGLIALAPALAAAQAVAKAATPTSAPCPAPDAPVLERFISADCPDCWASAQAPQPAAGAWLFDWISPTQPDAPLAPAALRDAAERASRANSTPPVGQKLLVLRAGLPQVSPLKLGVQTGPAWNGYVGTQLSAQGPMPLGATGWVALLEMIPAGAEGSALPRELVRAVAGPLPLDEVRADRPLTHLAALRWPEGSQPTRLVARAWIESADGHWLAIASEGCPAGW